MGFLLCHSLQEGEGQLQDLLDRRRQRRLCHLRQVQRSQPQQRMSTDYIILLFPFRSRIHFFSKQAKVCCSYAAPSALTGVQGFDCVHIPNALSNGANGVPEMSHLCGNNLGLPGATRCCEGKKFLYLHNLEFIGLIDLLKHQFLQDQLFPCSFFCSLKNQSLIP